MTDDESIAVPKVHTRSLAEVGSGKVVLVNDPLQYKPLPMSNFSGNPELTRHDRMTCVILYWRQPGNSKINGIGDRVCRFLERSDSFALVLIY
jgi:hypothetical protein